MTNPNIFVDTVKGISTPSEAMTAEPGKPLSQLVTVSFQSGKSCFLNMSLPKSVVWAEVLDSLRQENQPVFVEIDPKTNVITELLCPLTVKVGEITPTDQGGDVEVELIVSHALHYLRSKQVNFKELLKTLQTAHKQGTKVIVTETDENEIIDVRPFVKLTEGGRK